MAIADLRKDYTLGSLHRASLAADPMAQFQHWFADATAVKSPGGWLRRVAIGLYKWWLVVLGAKPVDPNAMALATVDPDGQPSVRTVLLKGVDERGFLFFTNYESRKGRELDGNPRAALVFYWSDLERQVCVSGRVSKLTAPESDKYFQSRPRGSRIGAWASAQGEVVPNREFLEARWKEIETRFPKDVPLPPFWGGYALAPERIEFWQGRASRLHDRFNYVRDANGHWNLERLAP
jgi:pyridoxamine 5'-phosphate oxidase